MIQNRNPNPHHFHRSKDSLRMFIKINYNNFRATTDYIFNWWYRSTIMLLCNQESIAFSIKRWLREWRFHQRVKWCHRSKISCWTSRRVHSLHCWQLQRTNRTGSSWFTFAGWEGACVWNHRRQMCTFRKTHVLRWMHACRGHQWPCLNNKYCTHIDSTFRSSLSSTWHNKFFMAFVENCIESNRLPRIIFSIALHRPNATVNSAPTPFGDGYAASATKKLHAPI